ncbi:hypothetical protein GpartN1_g4949.t1 [Galdieria partita]|uniref:mannose-6-phosphate isomerase n=1 Tax=Galdieria partita TaxID=83374 RepID=A0A9C7PYK9_9RHOD|nr:hypothetical protein GpartN1_g4949.t1 [Galdieria partita]
MFPLLVNAQQYDWGRPAAKSTVYKLLKSNRGWVKELEPYVELGPIDETRPFAELWVGTHPSLPSFVVQSSLCSLEKFLLEHNICRPDNTWLPESTKSLPFLLKVLSIQKTLSIQAHPDLTLAQKLHRNNPKNYPDENHKPEMAVALTTCEVLYGFRKLEKIVMALQTHEEIRDACGHEAVELFLTQVSVVAGERRHLLLRNLVASLLGQSQEIISSCIFRLLPKMRVSKSSSSNIDDMKYSDLFIRLYEQHGIDSGVILSLFLNFITLEPGEALFIAANEPHAYVSGELVEIMSCSDNVVRAGLTSKHKDVPTLLNMLTFEEADPQNVKFSGKVVENGVVCYTPPVNEFELEFVHLKSSRNFQVKSICVVLCLFGYGKIYCSCQGLKRGSDLLPFKEGSCVCLLENSLCTIENLSSKDLFYCVAHVRHIQDA